MRRRLILSTALIALAAVVVLGVPLGVVEAARLREDQTSRLEREADAVAGAADDRIEAGKPVSRSLLRRFSPAAHRIMVVPRRGAAVTTGPPLPGETLEARAGTGIGGIVIAQAPMGELSGRVHSAWLLIALLSLGGVLTAVLLAALQARRLARPLEAIAFRSMELGDGDFSVRAGHFDVPEIDAIARGLDSSASRIAELVAREREFSANVSHQLRTPLTALRLRLEEAGGASDPQTRESELAAALTEADRLESTIADLLAYARRTEPGGATAVNLGGVAHDHAARWAPVFAKIGRRLEVSAEKNVLVRASRGTVGQILDVLLDNALRHGRGPARIGVRADGRAASLLVSDAGPGVRAADADRIFERGASRSSGTGIGLHLARALAEADSASLRALDGAPTQFELRLARLDG